MPEKLRTDARRNRDTIVATARAVFGEQGLDAALDEIAKRAGVGSATLYRRFPTRRALVAAVFADRMISYAEAVEEALANPDPWLGFRDYVLFVCRLQATDRGLADLLVMSVPGEAELERTRDRAYRGFVELVDRAGAAGALRPDFTPDDLVLVLMANAGVVHRTAATAPDAWERFAAFVLDGLRAEAATEAPAGPGRTALFQAMASGAGALGCGE